MYAVTSEGCTLAASRADHDLPAEIDALARKHLAQERDHDANTGELDHSSATAWAASRGRWYRTILLGHPEPNGFVVTGLGLVVGDPDAPFRNMTQVATQLSRYAGLGR